MKLASIFLVAALILSGCATLAGGRNNAISPTNAPTEGCDNFPQSCGTGTPGPIATQEPSDWLYLPLVMK